MSKSLPTAAPKRAHPPRVPFALLLLGLAGGAMCLLLALNTASAANELHRRDLAAKDASVADSLVQLRNEVAASSAPDNLAAAAARLGMVPAGHPAFLVIGADGKLSILGHPGAADAAPVYIPPSNSPQSTLSAPSTSSHASPKAATTSAATPSASGSASAGKSGAATSSAQPSTSASTSSSTHTSAPPAPTPTPTPNSTLSGGPR